MRECDFNAVPITKNNGVEPAMPYRRSVLLSLVFVAAGVLFLAGDASSTSSGRDIFSHYFGPSAADCQSFELRLEFARGYISFEPPTAPDGRRVVAAVRFESGGPLTLSVGEGDCVVVMKVERKSS